MHGTYTLPRELFAPPPTSPRVCGVHFSCGVPSFLSLSNGCLTTLSASAPPSPRYPRGPQPPSRMANTYGNRMEPAPLAPNLTVYLLHRQTHFDSLVRKNRLHKSSEVSLRAVRGCGGRADVCECSTVTHHTQRSCQQGAVDPRTLAPTLWHPKPLVSALSTNTPLHFH